jgi:hypothetical protein
MEVWTGTHANYDNIHVFGCPAYYHVHDEKLDPRARKAIHLGSCDGFKGYQLWCLQGKKIVISSDVTFGEMSMLKDSSVTNVSSPISVDKKSIVSEMVVEREVTTLDDTRVIDSVEEASEEQVPLDEGPKTSRKNVSQQPLWPSLAS